MNIKEIIKKEPWEILQQYEMKEVPFSFLIGEIIRDIIVKKTDTPEAIYYVIDNMLLVQIHITECCEAVWLKETNGLEDILHSRILDAEEYTGRFERKFATFYKIRTVDRYCDITFTGESNGCYTLNAPLYLVARERTHGIGNIY